MSAEPGKCERDPTRRGGLSVWFDKYDSTLNAAAQRLPEIPAMNTKAGATKALKVTCLASDRGYRPFLLMLEHGIPLGAVWDRCIKAGLDPKHLLDDPSGPAREQPMRDPKKEVEDAVTLFCNRMENEPFKAHAADWNPMQRSSIRTTDAALLPRTSGMAQQQRYERRRQSDAEERQRQRAAPGYEPFIPIQQDINRTTADQKKVRQMRRNYPHLYSSSSSDVYKSTRGTGIGVPVGEGDIQGFHRPVPTHAEAVFWRQADRGRVRDLCGTWGATQGGGGFSLPVGSRVPITWKSQAEIEATWKEEISRG